MDQHLTVYKGSFGFWLHYRSSFPENLILQNKSIGMSIGSLDVSEVAKCLKESFNNVFDNSFSSQSRSITVIELLLAYSDMIDLGILKRINVQNNIDQEKEDLKTISWHISRRRRIYTVSADLIKFFCTDFSSKSFLQAKYFAFVDRFSDDFTALLSKAVILRKSIAKSEVEGGGGIRGFLQKDLKLMSLDVYYKKLGLVRTGGGGNFEGFA